MHTTRADASPNPVSKSSHLQGSPQHVRVRVSGYHLRRAALSLPEVHVTVVGHGSAQVLLKNGRVSSQIFSVLADVPKRCTVENSREYCGKTIRVHSQAVCKH
jgi:hypothetical protein